MVRKEDKIPPVLAVSGGQSLLRRRFLAEVISSKKEESWDVVYVDGASPSAVRESLDGGLFETNLTLAIVENPHKVELDFLERHLGSKSPTTTLLLHIEGEPDSRTKFGKFVKSHLKAVHKNFPLPTDWKATEVASAFVQQEALKAGLSLPAGLATALVQKSGTDLGVLSFEMDKIITLAQLEGVTTIEPRQVARLMAPIAEASVLPIMDALSDRNQRRLMKALWALKRTSKGDQTIRVCRLLGSSVSRWMQAAYLDSMPPKAAAESLGVHPWFFENKILPASKRWGKQGTIALLEDLAASERAVFSGALDPWSLLTARLLSSCISR